MSLDTRSRCFVCLLVTLSTASSGCGDDAGTPRRSVAASDAGRDAGALRDAGTEDVDGGPADAALDAAQDADAAGSGDAGDAEVGDGDAGSLVLDGATAEDYAQEVAEGVCEQGCPEVVITCAQGDGGLSCQAILRPWEAGECQSTYATQLPSLLSVCDSAAYRDALSACVDVQRQADCITQAEADQAAMDAEMGISGSVDQFYGPECEAVGAMTRACTGS